MMPFSTSLAPSKVGKTPNSGLGLGWFQSRNGWGQVQGVEPSPLGQGHPYLRKGLDQCAVAASGEQGMANPPVPQPQHPPPHGMGFQGMFLSLKIRFPQSVGCSIDPHTPPHTNPTESGPKTLFRLKIERNQKIHDFRPKKRGGHFLTPPPPPSKPPKSGFQVGGGSHWGMHLLHKIMILQGVKLTIQPHGVGYANSPQKGPKWGGMWCFPPNTPAWL